MNFKKQLVLTVACLILAACSSTDELEMPNSPCACTYEGKALQKPTQEEYDYLLDEIYS